MRRADGTVYIESRGEDGQVDVVATGVREDVIPAAKDPIPAHIGHHVWLGSQDAAETLESLTKNNITCVLNVGFSEEAFPGQFKWKRISIYDVPEEKLEDRLPEMFQFIEECGAQQQNVIVHCNAGISRSASVVIAWLMWKKLWTFQQALFHVQQARPSIRPNAGFVEQLKKFNPTSICVAGHVCLDVIPLFDDGEGKKGEQQNQSNTADVSFPAGSLIHVGKAHIAPGGCVSNVGLGLTKLIGPRVALKGKIGSDIFGEALLGQLLPSSGPMMMVCKEGGATSYSIVLQPPGTDRVFLHHPGVNNTFASSDVISSVGSEGWLWWRHLHFGYPPLLRNMMQEDGEDIKHLFSHVRKRAPWCTISMDMSSPDPNSEAGRLDWIALLKNVLPETDYFVPSIGELAFMMREKIEHQLDLAESLDLASRLANQCSQWGCRRIVAIKMGEHGLYVRHCVSQREFFSPIFVVPHVAGTTGSGDATVAGFLAAIMQSSDSVEDLPHAITIAVAVGAFSVEQVDATGGICSMDEVLTRLQDDGWKRKLVDTPPNWIQKSNIFMKLE